jgi:transposase InsO family protein
VDQYQLGGQALGQCDGEGQGGEMPEQREDAVVGAGKLADALLDGDTLQLILDSNEERRGDRRPASGSQAARDALARRLRGHNSHGRRGEPRRFAARTHPPGQIDFNNKAVLQARLEPGQFVSLAFGQQARAAGIAQSMGSKGDCFDNAVAESFFATLKKSSSTAAPGRRRPSCGPRSSRTSRSSSTADVGTPRSAFSRPSSSRRSPTTII